MPSVQRKPTPARRPTAKPQAPGEVERLCMAIIWVQDELAAARRQGVQEALASQPGVRAARFARVKPCLMVVDYDPGRTGSDAMLAAVRGRGLRARIVGC